MSRIVIGHQWQVVFRELGFVHTNEMETASTCICSKQ